MTLTGTIYPPAGATALLATTEPAIIGLGWLYVGIVVLATVVMLAVAAVVNNVMRRWPMYWWSPQAVAKKKQEEEQEEKKDEEKRSGAGMVDEEAIVGCGGGGGDAGEEMKLIVSAQTGVVVPKQLRLSDEEWRILRILEERIREVSPTASSRGRPETKCDDDDDHDEVQSESSVAASRGRGSSAAEDNKLDRVDTFGSTSTLRSESFPRHDESARGLK